MLYYNQLLPLADVVRLTLCVVLYTYVRKMENIKCLTYTSWKPTYIKFYSVVTIILIVLSLFSKPNFNLTALIVSITIPMSLVLVYAVYTYIRELEESFRTCPLSKDVKYVHEFLKLYSLVNVLCIVVMCMVVVSSVVSLIKFPKYMGIQERLNNEMRCRLAMKKQKRKTRLQKLDNVIKKHVNIVVKKTVTKKKK